MLLLLLVLLCVGVLGVDVEAVVVVVEFVEFVVALVIFANADAGNVNINAFDDNVVVVVDAVIDDDVDGSC